MRSSFFISSLVGAVSLWGCGSGLANPIAVDTSRRTATMIAEDVRVLVDARVSKISGVYKFHLDATYWGERADARVDIYVPVLLARDENTPEDIARRRPIVRLGRRQFISVEKDDLPFGDEARFVKLPKGWFMRFYLFQIPVRLLRKQFEITVDYVQPHFPGDVVGYVPLDPPREPGAGRIRFEATKGRALKKAGELDLFSKPVASLDVTPQDRKLIKVRSVVSRE